MVFQLLHLRQAGDLKKCASPWRVFRMTAILRRSRQLLHHHRSLPRVMLHTTVYSSWTPIRGTTATHADAPAAQQCKLVLLPNQHAFNDWSPLLLPTSHYPLLPHMQANAESPNVRAANRWHLQQFQLPAAAFMQDIAARWRVESCALAEHNS